MKKTLVTFAFLFCLCSNIFGNVIAETGERPVLEKVSEQITRQMVNQLGLNELEFIKINKLNQIRLLQATENYRKFSNDPEMLTATLNSLDEEFEDSLFLLLNSRQVEAYAIFKLDPANCCTSLLKLMKAEAQIAMK